MPIERTGRPPEPPPPPRRPSEVKGWLEYPETPCKTCGDPLIQNYTDRLFYGRDDYVRSSGPKRCRNGCSVAEADEF